MSFDDLSGIDPEVLAIMKEYASSPYDSFNESSQQNTVKEDTIKVNEISAKTSALDSKGNLLSVGDKVRVGNDKALGRIISLGRYAKVNIAGEGEFDFPCSVLTLVTNEYTGGFSSNEPMTESNNSYNVSPRINNSESYSISSLIKSHVEEGEDTLDDINESLERLKSINDGESFNMGI